MLKKNRMTHLFTITFKNSVERNLALGALEEGAEFCTDYIAHFYSSATPSHLLVSISDAENSVVGGGSAKKQFIEGLLQPLGISSYSFVGKTALNSNAVEPVVQKSPTKPKHSINQLPSKVLAACGRVRLGVASDSE